MSNKARLETLFLWFKYGLMTFFLGKFVLFVLSLYAIKVTITP